MNSDLAYQLKISLRGSKPSIWRRIQVPAHINFKKLHEILQCTMGWWNCHLHEFEIRKVRIVDAETDDEFDPDESLNEVDIRLLDMFKDGRLKKLTYIYDFGDGWLHDVELEETFSKELKFATCIDGRRKCPPEDVGGLGGFYNFLQASQNSKHPMHREWMDWYGKSFDPDEFDSLRVDVKLRKIRIPKPRSLKDQSQFISDRLFSN